MIFLATKYKSGCVNSPSIGSCATYFSDFPPGVPINIFNWYDISEILKLECFDYVDDLGSLHKNKDLERGNILPKYGCGIYTFIKL